MTVHVTIALDEAVKAKLDALADARQAPIDEIVAMAVLDLVEAAPFVSADDEAAFEAAVDEGLRSLNAGEGIPHEVVVAELRARQAARPQR